MNIKKHIIHFITLFSLIVIILVTKKFTTDEKKYILVIVKLFYVTISKNEIDVT